MTVLRYFDSPLSFLHMYEVRYMITECGFSIKEMSRLPSQASRRCGLYAFTQQSFGSRLSVIALDLFIKRRHRSYSVSVKLHLARSCPKLRETISGSFSNLFSGLSLLFSSSSSNDSSLHSLGLVIIVLLAGGLGYPKRQSAPKCLKHDFQWFLLCICTSFTFLYSSGCVCGLCN